MTERLDAYRERLRGFLPDLLGVRLLEVSSERVIAELEVRRELCTVPGILHGGAIMALADTLGAVATVANIPPGAGTTTIDSKSNFFLPGREGTVVRGETTALHKGRRTMTWQTRVTDPDGRLLAVVTQTQLILPPEGP